MKHFKFTTFIALILVFALNLGSIAFAAESVPLTDDSETILLPEVSRETYAEQFAGSELVDMVMNNQIVEDEFTSIEVTDAIDTYGDRVVTVELDELKERSYEDGIAVETHEKQVISAIAASSSADKTEWVGSAFSVTVNLTYEKATPAGVGGPLYKILSISGKYTLSSGRYEFKSLYLLAGQSGKAFTSTLPSSIVGTKSERVEMTVNNPTSGMNYTKTTYFLYYIESVSLVNVGGYTTVNYTFSNDPTIRTFPVDIALT